MHKVPYLIFLKANETLNGFCDFNEYFSKQVFCIHVCSGVHVLNELVKNQTVATFECNIHFKQKLPAGEKATFKPYFVLCKTFQHAFPDILTNVRFPP